MQGTSLLVLNSGSSSLKFGLFSATQAEVRAVYRGEFQGIGSPRAKLQIQSAEGQVVHSEPEAASEQTDALRAIATRIYDLSFPAPAAIGHRVVHGGPSLRDHQKITPLVLKALEEAAPFAPLHVPTSLKLIRESERLFTGVPQFACFDTAFHRTLPEAAARFALPEKFWSAGVRRYGFHGLSCESILYSLGSDVPARLIVAHLGSGASVTAIANGRSIDTTMGLTPTGGVVMGTRCGDLDPGVLLYILRTTNSTPEELEKLLDKQSGLLGISGVSSDMRQLHAAAENTRAQLAVEMFVRSVKKAIAGFVATLGGLDMLVFTGGIGENDAAVRSAICDGLQCLGVFVEDARNERNAGAISGRVRVCVLPSEEDAQIARHTYRLLSKD